MMENQVFLSYAHLDNRPVNNLPGWITRFHSSLQAFLDMRLGYESNIWRDDSLQGNDIFADEIQRQLQKAAAIISVLTPRYVESPWCSKEAKDFYEKALKGQGIRVKNKSRIFKVIKLPIPKDKLSEIPSVIREGILEYKFFTMDGTTPLELDPGFGEEYGQAYNRKVAALANDIASLIKDMGGLSDMSQEEAMDEIGTKPTVYLAQCSYDLREYREILELELKQHGYEVLPKRQLPLDDADQYIDKVKELIEQSTLSIHLVGANPGAVPDGQIRKSITIWQNELAVERSQSEGLSRLIWLPEGTISEDKNQQNFITALHQDPKAQLGADLITGNIEELKNSIHLTLKKQQKSQTDQNESKTYSHESRLIFLYCNRNDRKATIPIRKYLKENNFEVELPAFEGDANEVREANQQLIDYCDGILLFYGVGSEAWKRHAMSDLRKKLISRQPNPPVIYTFLANPFTEDKEEILELEESNTINGLKTFSKDMLDDFLGDLSL